MADNTVLIVGAGPVGLCLAWRLHQAAVEVRVFETQAAISDQLRASTFHPPTLDMLEPSGITAELIACGRITADWQIRMHDSGERALFDLGVLKNDTAHPYRLQCHQAELSRALFRRLPENTVRFDCQAQGLGQDANGAWVNTGDELVRGRWLIGCDGARSVVRKAMGVSFEGGTYPDSTILVSTRFPFEEHLDGLSGVNYIWKQGGTYSLLQLPDVWRVSLHPQAGQSPEQALQDNAIHDQTREILPDAPSPIILEKRIYQVHHRVASAYRNRNFLLAGDAAHLNSPKGGMGLNGGIHDAFALADALTARLNGANDDVLDRYQRQRRPVASDEIIAQADSNRKRMNTTDPEQRALHLKSLQTIADDRQKSREFLLKSSMISGLRVATGSAWTLK